MAKLSKEELEKIHKLMTDFNQLKIQLGDTTITQHNLLAKVDELKIQYAEEENLLIEKYGQDAVINVQTGDVQQKEK